MNDATTTTTSNALRQGFKARMSSIRWNPRGKVTDVVGTIVEASLPASQLGSLVEIAVDGPQQRVLAEVVSFRKEHVILLPYTDVTGIRPGALVTPQSMLDKIPVGNFLLGQVVDPFINSLTGNKNLVPEKCDFSSIDMPAPNPMERSRITRSLGLGIRALDGLLTFGDGQRMGIMAGAGVGKSVLLGMIARDTDADVNVIGLIGERGREVREFLERDLGPEGLKKSVVVAVTGDQSPLMKVRAAKVVTSIAEHFSRCGKRVLIMMDSLTRVAMAQREIGLAIGEAPTTKGYTPSVFALLPRLLERSGPQMPGRGNISALYSVLAEGDDLNDPIADSARSILDGQINLTRALAAKGHYPAIDVTTSISRVMSDIATQEHLRLANRMKSLLGTYNENFDLVQIGAYQPGANPKLDEALAMMPLLERYLMQSTSDRSTIDSAVLGLRQIFAARDMAQKQQAAS